jgi:hypothetical protein
MQARLSVANLAALAKMFTTIQAGEQHECVGFLPRR